MPKIRQVKARQIIDCKCRPVVEVDIETSEGIVASGAAPTGSSVGMYEAYVLRDGNPDEYNGLSVHKAVDNVNHIIAPALIGMDIMDQRAIDQRMIELDGSANKSNLGGNAVYSVSIAALRAAASSQNIPVYKLLCGRDIKTVPVPTFNVINGGRYGDLVQPFNEFLLVPYGAHSIDEAVEMAVKCFQRLESIISAFSGCKPLVASSYGWAAPSNDPDTVLGLMQKAAEECGFGDQVAFALDCASSEMYDAKTDTYLLHDKRVGAQTIISYLEGLTKKYPMLFIEDPLDENDWDNYTEAARVLKRTILVGDDLIATDVKRIRKAYECKAVEGFILKPNQIGTITEALDTHQFARKHNMLSIPSGRSGGVVGDIVMDFSVGLEVLLQKNGAPRSGERIDKLNFLIRACDSSPDCKMADITHLLK